MNRQAFLEHGASELGVSLATGQIEQLLEYLDLMQRWNKSFNLTAINDPQKMLSYHGLDSLSIATEIGQSDNVLDVGSGAGLPGIPLAILYPEASFMLLDSNGKKTRFIQQAIAHCKLVNVEVVKQRVQDYHATKPFDVIVSRAYASIHQFVESVSHLITEQTRLIAMKTKIDNEERSGIDARAYSVSEKVLSVPGISESRTLIRLQQK